MIVLEILSPLSLRSDDEARDIFFLWKQHLPETLPDYYGNWEPIDKPFDPENPLSALADWKWPFFAIRNSPHVDAALMMRKGARQQLHSTLRFSIDSATISQSHVRDFLIATTVRLKADFGLVHLLSKRELELGRSNDTVKKLDREGTKLHFILASRDLKVRIPELYWITIFGDSYIQLFGIDRLMSSPAFRTELISEDCVLVQLTQDLSDVEHHPELIANRRELIKNHLGKDAFFQTDAPVGFTYRAPEFNFHSEE